MAKAADIEDVPESDVFPGAPHPRRAKAFIGHAAAEAELLAAYRSGRTPHAWLIAGPEGIGKATLAWRMARFVLAHPDPSAPAVQRAQDLSVDRTHPAAAMLDAVSHPDFALVRREWKPATKSMATEIAIDTVRKATATFHLAAAFGGWRIAIVDSADDFNRNSANAILKLIEEPPDRSLFLILAHRPGQVLPTIRSRCRLLRLEGLSEAEIARVVAGLGPPWSEVGEAGIAAAAARANGSVREALARLSPEAEEVGALIDATLERLPEPDPRAVLKLADALSARSAEEAFQTFHRALYDRLADYARCDATSATRVDELGALWDRVRQAARETEALNLDRRIYLLALFADIAETARRLRGA